MATAVMVTKEILEPREVSVVEVTLSTREAKLLASLRGFIAGELNGPRGEICRVLRGIGDAIGHDDYRTSAEEAGLRVTRGMTVEQTH